MEKDPIWQKLKEEVIDPGLCTQCGTCVGLSRGALDFKEKRGIPIPVKKASNRLSPMCFEACPAKYCNYPALNRTVFGEIPKNWLSGTVDRQFVGYSANPPVRCNGASGGAISEILIYLLESKKIAGAVCLELGAEEPFIAKPIIAKTKEDILRCAQSVYSVSPMNTILESLDDVRGPLAYVGLPDQVASIRKLQSQGHKGANKIKYVLGPYMGTQMYFESIRSFLRSNGVRSEKNIISLKYRAGEWPGYLEIKLRGGRVLRAEKFYYNYLIPFYITSSSLQLVDFTNELTDISVGDAWSPKYEKMGGGYSVILSRTPKATALLTEMVKKNKLVLEPVSISKALEMHGHMLDFKKRGSFIRNGWRKSAPDYGYMPVRIPFKRKLVEFALMSIFLCARQRWAKWIVEHIPISIVGPCFNTMRKSWKAASKPTKRKGLSNMRFTLTQ